MLVRSTLLGRLCLIISVCIAASVVAVAPAAAASAVSVTGGTVQGFPRDGVMTYLGVPFATAERFALPHAAAPWPGVRRADQHGPQCPQALPTPGISLPSSVPFPTSENCLNIDLYVPPHAAGHRLPVMVYLFGGAFVLGSNLQYDSPAELARTGNVIVAVPNYRVGPFGFLALPELAAESDGATGTYGIADQQFALRWVRDNIGRFGGDPHNVTIFGESAGGMSVCSQLAARGSAGLFTKAIVQSGACEDSPLVPPPVREGYRRSAAYAASLGCTERASRVACLRSLPIEKLLDSPTTKFNSAAITWTPFRDGVVVARTPGEALAAGAASHIPMIVGSNAEEGGTFVALFDYAQGKVPTAAGYRDEIRTLYPDHWRQILATYPVSRYGSPTRALSAVYTDSLFACPADQTTRSAAAGGTTVWQYRSTAAPLGENPVLPGAFHASDIPYLFNRLGGIPIPWTGKPAQLAAQWKRQWTTFAHTGNPNGPGLPAWTPWTRYHQRFLSIGVESSHMRGGFTSLHRCGFWKSLAN
ncbi:carboxylesterase/lipase family protein [Gordonia sp. NPDC003950]